MIKHYCDICEKPISGRPNRVDIVNPHKNSSYTMHYDLCDDCIAGVQMIFDRKGKVVPLEESVDEEPDTEPGVVPKYLGYHRHDDEVIFECPTCGETVGSWYLFNHKNRCYCGQKLIVN